MGYFKNKKPSKFNAKEALEEEKKEVKAFASTHENAIKEGEKARAENKAKAEAEAKAK